MEQEKTTPVAPEAQRDSDGVQRRRSSLLDVRDEDIINASGHKQELDRLFSPFSIISTAITTGNVWVCPCLT